MCVCATHHIRMHEGREQNGADLDVDRLPPVGVEPGHIRRLVCINLGSTGLRISHAQ